MAMQSRVDFLVMGAGVAGLRAVIELARHGDVPCGHQRISMREGFAASGEQVVFEEC